MKVSLYSYYSSSKHNFLFSCHASSYVQVAISAAACSGKVPTAWVGRPDLPEAICPQDGRHEDCSSGRPFPSPNDMMTHLLHSTLLLLTPPINCDLSTNEAKWAQAGPPPPPPRHFDGLGIRSAASTPTATSYLMMVTHQACPFLCAHNNDTEYNSQI